MGKDKAIGEESENPCRKVYGGMILGRSPFIKEVLRKLKGQYLQKEEISHRRVLHEAYGMEEIIERFSAALKRDKKLRKRIADIEKGM